LVDCPEVHDRLRRTLTAEHDEKVAHHGRLPLVVELDDGPAREKIERHFHYPDRTFNDPLARGDDRARLLPSASTWTGCRP
jgi:hypothetical protein